MALARTYARRKRERTEAGNTKVLRESPVGLKLLTQLSQNFDTIDLYFDPKNRVTDEVTIVLREEIGVLSLANYADLRDDFKFWWFNEPANTTEEQHDMRLSAIELMCKLALDKAKEEERKPHYLRHSGSVRPLPSIRQIVAVINARMLEDGFGFQFHDDQLIEITSEFSYKEVIEPALVLMRNPIFGAADDEFRDAFDEFKERNYDDCIADCGNAFESVIKVIAAQKGWHDVQPTDPASKLIEALYRHELIPSWMQEQMKGLKSMLQGTPTVRNKEASHGAGEAPRQVSKELAAYQLHQTAAVILFLISQAKLA